GRPHTALYLALHQAVAGSPAGTWRARSSASGNVARIVSEAISAMVENTTRAQEYEWVTSKMRPAMIGPSANPKVVNSAWTPNSRASCLVPSVSPITIGASAGGVSRTSPNRTMNAATAARWDAPSRLAIPRPAESKTVAKVVRPPNLSASGPETKVPTALNTNIALNSDAATVGA